MCIGPRKMGILSEFREQTNIVTMSTSAVCVLCAQVPRAVPPGEQPPVVRERCAAVHPGLVGHARRRGPARRQVHTQRRTFTFICNARYIHLHSFLLPSSAFRLLT